MINDKKENQKLILSTFPSLVSDNNETEGQFNERWDKFDALDDALKNKLSSKDTSENIQQLGTLFGIQLSQLAIISRAIRNYYFGKLKIEEISIYLAKEIPTDLSKAQEIAKLINEKIISNDSQEKSHQENLEHITLTDAIKAYTEIGEQLITSNRISLKMFPEPARPSIKNWLADYTFTLGHNTHTSIERGNYIFQGSNGKNLNSQDRERLGYVLRAYDENSPVTVDKVAKQIVFPENSNNSKAQPFEIAQTPSRLSLETSNASELSSNNSQSQLRSSTPDISTNQPTSKISYSSPQRMPYERTKTQPYRITPVFGKQQTTDTQKNDLDKKDMRTLGKNVVNLRDNQ